MPAVSFLADDLTGAADVLAQAHRYGLDAVLVVGGGDTPLPTDADVVGIAGPARSLGGEAFDELVRAQLAQIARTGAEVLLYKVCSTFDSLPTLGSIGRGIELLREQFAGLGPVAVAPAQPQFGRYTAFSNHFGVFADQVHRLDRHPVMSRHPSTPMHEADLRQVLAEQFTDRQVPAAVHLPAYADGSFTERWRPARSESVPAFVVDAVTDAHLDEVARALRSAAQTSAPHPSVVVGSGGIMAALARTATGRDARQPGPQHASGPVLVVSASASSTTAAQIGDAVTHGWADVRGPGRAAQERRPGPGRRTSRSTPPQRCPQAATSSSTPRGAARTRGTRRQVRSTHATSAGCSAPSPGGWPPPGSPATSPCSAATPPATP